MNHPALQLTLMLGWLWIFAGFISGMILGMNFQRADWLGGYGSWKRRLYRLGHISFFGLGALNLLFWITARAVGFDPASSWIASGAFVLGALTMPACCVLAAHWPGGRILFAIPVVSLMAGGGITLWQLFIHQPLFP